MIAITHLSVILVDGTLGPLDTAPYYALELTIGTFGTKAGPKVDTDGRVIELDGNLVRGLYAAGNVSSPTGASCAGPGGTRAGHDVRLAGGTARGVGVSCVCETPVGGPTVEDWESAMEGGRVTRRVLAARAARRRPDRACGVG